MIKDKITPSLREKFRQTIKRTIDTGRGQGFFICSDKQGELYPSKPCEGDEYKIILEGKSTICSHKIGGDFHTHPYLANTKRKYKDSGKQIPIDNILIQDITQSLTDKYKEKGITELSPIIPSHKDALNALLHKCLTTTETTTCVGSDLEKDKIECWTPKETINKGQCVRAIFELRGSAGQKKGFFPKKWIIPLFDKEQITL